MRSRRSSLTKHMLREEVLNPVDGLNTRKSMISEIKQKTHNWKKWLLLTWYLFLIFLGRLC
jgi:hypothetical protein